MECRPPPLPPSVIEGVLEVTTVYEITLETRIRLRPVTLCPSCQSAVAQEPQQAKSRPVATIRPFPTTKEQDENEDFPDSLEAFGKDTEFPETKEKQEKVFTNHWEEKEEVWSEDTKEEGLESLSSEVEDKEELRSEDIEEKSCENQDKVEDKKEVRCEYTAEESNEDKYSEVGEYNEELYSDNTAKNNRDILTVENGTYTFSEDRELKKSQKKTETTQQQPQEPKSPNHTTSQAPQPQQPFTHPKHKEKQDSQQQKTLQQPHPNTPEEKHNPKQEYWNPCTCHRNRIREAFTPHPNTKGKTSERRKESEQKHRNPCSCHRERIQEAFRSSIVAPKRMEGCQNGNCHEGERCGEEYGSGEFKGEQYKETSITECLDEFLEELQLTHLGNYLRVLGCTCVRDLRLLEEPELNAIQLISRRRLLKRLECLSLHHEAPPSECSLEGWLTWYGLNHISGFLAAIGVHSVGDLSYLREEDLELLKPVTRRRILSLYRK